jgi:ribonuclease D
MVQQTGQIEIITTRPALEALASRLEREPLVACDLEGDSLHHYRERVCLLQFSIPGESVLVDPLALDDLSPLAPVMADPAIRKVLHGADYDIRSLHRDFGIEVNNLFDTMIACQFLGEKEVGLAAVLKKRFGAELDKRYQKADWSKRPLSPEMIEYAMRDTSLLLELYLQLEKELRAKGRLTWVEEEFALLTQVRSNARGDEPLVLRFKGAAKMKPRELTVLEGLLQFREERARQRDLPPFKILGGDLLRELAETRPRTTAELAAVPGMSDRIMQKYGRGILEVIAQGADVAEGRLLQFPQGPVTLRDPRREARLKRCKLWRSAKSQQLGIDPGVLANNTLLTLLADLPAGAQALGHVEPLLKVWQKKEFGPELRKLLETEP